LRVRRGLTVVVVPLVAGAIAACGDKPKPAGVVPGKTLSGETETGMKLKVETFYDPAKDPNLKRINDWRASNRYAAVDFHRVTADNSGGPGPDNGRTLRFSPSAQGLATGTGIEARFTCDALEFEWLPIEQNQAQRWSDLRREICADGPPKPEGIPAGTTKVYYLITDRGFAERGIRRMRVFGPRDTELK